MGLLAERVLCLVPGVRYSSGVALDLGRGKCCTKILAWRCLSTVCHIWGGGVSLHVHRGTDDIGCPVREAKQKIDD